MSSARVCSLLQLGLTPYGAGYDLQRRLMDAVRRDRGKAFLLLLEHPPVLTIGRRGTERNIVAGQELLAREGIEVFETDRGGDITYHGPGQIVGYPIMALEGARRDVHRYLRSLEAVLIRTVAHFGIDAGRKKGYTGVWVGPEKLASIGVGFTSWICFHGFALNVDPCMRHFELIHPCGLKGVRMTSISRLLGRRVAVDEARQCLVPEFAREFEFDRVAPVDIGTLADAV